MVSDIDTKLWEKNILWGIWAQSLVETKWLQETYVGSFEKHMNAIFALHPILDLQ